MWNPGAERLQTGGLQGELVLGAADGGIDGQILSRLQIQLDAWHSRHRILQPFDHGIHAIVAVVHRFEIDLQTSAVQ
ncbi:hypothetical protein D3C81_2122360 [compost metagenome]